MFTGIIKGLGQVVDLDRSGETAQLTIQSDLLADIKPTLGDSFSINGTCLTAAGVAANKIAVEVMPETTRRTNLGDLVVGSHVNLEPALAANARIDGHFVLGHVDTTAVLINRVADQNAVILTFKIDSDYQNYIVEKGSIAIDGVSLTVTQASATQFSVSLIPYTLDQTTLGVRQIGDRVNIETDVLGKYIVAAQRKEAIQ